MVADRSVLVRLRADADQFVREMLKARAAVKGLADGINTTNNHTAWLARGIMALGPAVSTSVATAVPVLMGLATQATIGAAAVGTLVGAFIGLGDALDALNTYQLDPSVKNLEKLQDAMHAIGPDGASFVQVLDQVADKLSVLQMDARAGMFPGMAAGLDLLLDRLPDLRVVVSELSEGLGQLSIDAGQALGGAEWDDFFEYLKTDGQRILVDLGRTLGNFIDGFGELIVAFAPLTRDFSAGFLEMSRNFESWAQGLDATEGFQDFMAYVRENGPHVLDMFSALWDMILDVGKASSTAGEIIVPLFETIAKLVSAIANSPVGPVLILASSLKALLGAALALRALTAGGRGIFTPMTKQAGALRGTLGQLRTDLATVRNATLAQRHASSTVAAAHARANATMKQYAKTMAMAGGYAGAFALASGTVGGSLGLQNTAMLGLVGTMGGPWGVVAGATVGFLMDINKAGNNAAAGLRAVNAALDSGSVEEMNRVLGETRAQFDDMDNADGWWDSFTDGFSEVMTTIAGGAGDIRETRQGMELLEDAIEEAKKQEIEFAGQEKIRQKLEEDSAAAKEAGDAFRQLGQAYEAPKQSLQDLLQTMREWGEASANMGQSIQTALDQGVNPEALKSIIDDLGPGAALALKQLAEGGKQSAEELNAAWEASQGKISGYEAAVDAIYDAIRDTPKPALILDNRPFLESVREALDKANILDEADPNPFANLYIEPLLQAAAEAVKRMGEVENNGPKPKAELLGVEAVESQLARLTRERSVKINAFVTNTKDLLGAPDLTKKVTGDADGGLHVKGVKQYADGGFGANGRHYPRVPQIVPGGANILWGEEETGWEAYISGKPSQLARNRNIWLEAGRRLGMVEAYANGGTQNVAYATPYNPGNGGQAWAIAGKVRNELDRLSKQFGEIGTAVSASKKGLLAETKVRKNLLERELEASTKRLDAVRSEIEALKQSIDTRLKSNQWETNSPTQLRDLSGLTAEQQVAEIEAWKAVNAALVQDPRDILKADIAQANELKRLMKNLAGKGLDGDAFIDLASNASMDTIRMMAAWSASEVRNYEALFNQRDRAAASAGSTATALSGLAKERAAELAAVRATTAELKGVNKRLERLEAQAKKAPKETGTEVGKAINNRVNAGKAGR